MNWNNRRRPWLLKLSNSWVILLFLTNQSLGQDYIEYHRIFYRIDQDILSENFIDASHRLDSVYSTYPFVDAKHCLKALQICIIAHDSLKANNWLKQCFKSGIPPWIIKNNDITKKSLAYSSTENTWNHCDQYYRSYQLSIDTNLKQKIYSLLAIDQKYTKKLNDGFILLKPIFWLQWGINNQQQYKSLKKIIEVYGYPDEKLIGLPMIEESEKNIQHFTFWGPTELRNGITQIMLQHCFSTWHKIDFNFMETLHKNVVNGNMPPYQYALIMDFMLPNKEKYINNTFWFKKSYCKEKDLEIINKNRDLIGLNTFEQEEKNVQLEIQRRKNRKANSEIILE